MTRTRIFLSLAILAYSPSGKRAKRLESSARDQKKLAPVDPFGVPVSAVHS
jgi:hypothetical protein